MAKQFLGRYTTLEAALMAGACVLALTGMIWFSLTDSGHRQGPWLLAVLTFILGLTVVILRRRRGADS